MSKDLYETTNGHKYEKFIMSEIIRKGTKLMLQDLAEQGVTDFSGRDRYGFLKSFPDPLLVSPDGEFLRQSTGRPLAKDQGRDHHLKIPVRHRRSVRTTNLIERSIEKEKRRTS